MKINGVEVFDTVWGNRAPTEAQERAAFNHNAAPADQQPAAPRRRTVPAFPPVRRLICCCCGETTRGRQWWNRDTGYGLCAACAESIAQHETPEEMRSRYGDAGTHYNLAPYKPAPPLPTNLDADQWAKVQAADDNAHNNEITGGTP